MVLFGSFGLLASPANHKGLPRYRVVAGLASLLLAGESTHTLNPPFDWKEGPR